MGATSEDLHLVEGLSVVDIEASPVIRVHLSEEHISNHQADN